MKKSVLASLVVGGLGALPVSLLAHDGIIPHPEMHYEMTHLLVHALMALPVALGAWALVAGIKHYRLQRAKAHTRQRG